MGMLAGVLAGRCKGSERFSRGRTSTFFALKLPHDLDHINTWEGRRGTEATESGRRLKERLRE